jgi:hypothetical protein
MMRFIQISVSQLSLLLLYDFCCGFRNLIQFFLAKIKCFRLLFYISDILLFFKNEDQGLKQHILNRQARDFFF